MKQIREEQQRAREKDAVSNRAIQKLKKESRKHESKIKTLEAEARQKEIVLKRRQEEVGIKLGLFLGNFQQAVFSLGVSQHMNTITNL